MRKSPPRRQHEPRRLTIEDRRRYLKKVRKALPPEDYAVFAAVLIGFKEQRVGVGFLLAKVKDMFKGDKELLNGFNRLMPEKYKIRPTYGAHDWISAIGGSVELLNKIRKSFDDDDRTYMAFLEILGSCGKGRAEEERVHREVAELLAGEPALYVEFTRFLSD